MRPTLFTIGHSSHPLEKFLNLLAAHDVAIVGDVRSRPQSHFVPHFNQDALEFELKAAGIEYWFMGEELGGRPDDPECYAAGRVQFDRVAKSAAFQRGLEQVLMTLPERRLALMCSEKDPIMCHRMILVCRRLRAEDIDIAHILEDGSIETLEQAETRLVEAMGLPQDDLFLSRDEIVTMAYALQEERIGLRLGPTAPAEFSEADL